MATRSLGLPEAEGRNLFPPLWSIRPCSVWSVISQNLARHTKSATAGPACGLCIDVDISCASKVAARADIGKGNRAGGTHITRETPLPCYRLTMSNWHLGRLFPTRRPGHRGTVKRFSSLLDTIATIDGRLHCRRPSASR